MPLPGHQHPANPSVEDDMDSNRTKNEDIYQKEKSSQITSSELCAQHEKLMMSHLETLHIVMKDINGAGDTVRMVSNMVEMTNKLMTQFKILKKQLAPSSDAVGGQSNASTASNSNTSSRPTAEKSSRRRSRSKDRNKRARISTDLIDASSESTDSPNPETLRSYKRKRLQVSIPGDEQDVRHVTPVSIDTEDISQEVQRRLEIKEERRKKQNSNPKQEKRKRESVGSNGGTASFATAQKPRKRARLEMEAQGDIGIGKRGREGIYRDNGISEASDERRESKRHKVQSSSLPH